MKTLHPLFSFVVLAFALQMFAFPVSAEDITIQKNIPYVKDGRVRHQLDLYLPSDYEKAAKPLPVVVVIHGGGWANGSKDAPKFVEWAKYFAGHGYISAAINYRFLPEFKFPAQIVDSKSAIRFLRANAKKYNIDVNRFAAVGSSAGGHLVSLLATTSETKDFDQGEYLDQSSAVQAVADLCGPSDFLSFRTETNAAERLFGDKLADKEFVKKQSPFHQVSAKSAAVILLHATDDKTVPIEQSRTFHKALKDAGVETVLLEFPDGGHGSKHLTSAESKEKVLEFFNKQLNKK
jgi:acetyl esterase/lipase